MQDRYPAYITWETFEKIQDMLRDNHAEYDHNRPGIPRPGAALLHGLVYCGECGQRGDGRGAAATSAITCASSTACRSASISPPIRSTPGWWPRSSKPWPRRVGGLGTGRRQAADAMTRAEAQQVERLRYQAGLPSASSTASIPPTGWSRPSWNAAGKRRCASCAMLRTASPGVRPAQPARRDQPGPAPPSWRRAAAGSVAGSDARQRAPQGAAALPDRQGGRPPLRPRPHPGAHRLARRGDQRAGGRGSGR